MWYCWNAAVDACQEEGVVLCCSHDGDSAFAAGGSAMSNFGATVALLVLALSAAHSTRSNVIIITRAIRFPCAW